ncbi:MAG: hypothetical protein V3V00_10035 [Saprospiraceae bacterium]
MQTIIMIDINTLTYIDLKNVVKISRGSNDKMYTYLKQFSELISERSKKVKESMVAEDRTAMLQILHNMSPQIQFFGIHDVAESLKRMEWDYKTISIDKLKPIVEDILQKLNDAVDEVENILDNNYPRA